MFTVFEDQDIAFLKGVTIQFTTEQNLPLEAGKIVAHGMCSEVNWKYYCLH